jgi:predicted nucleic acid-binding protein
MNLFIDTNILLSFYHFSNEDLNRLKDLKSLIEADQIRLFATQQIIDEFNRNREGKIKDALRRFNSTELKPSIPKLCDGYEETENINKAAAFFKDSKKKLLEKLTEDVKNKTLKADQTIDEIFSAIKVIKIDEDTIKKAEKRMKIGNPPGKNNSYGDAINWISLLNMVPYNEDLFFVCSDGDYISPLNENELSLFLQEEWNKMKGSKIHFYRTLVDFFKENFPAVKITDEDIKNGKIETFSKSYSFDNARENLKRLSNISDFSDDQIIKIVKASLENDQINNAHQYSPEKIGKILNELIEGHEQKIPYNIYLSFCKAFDITPIFREEDFSNL